MSVLNHNSQNSTAFVILKKYRHTEIQYFRFLRNDKSNARN